MTKKDYSAIAAVLRQLGEEGSHCFDDGRDRQHIAYAFGRVLARDNSRFDMDRFIRAALPAECAPIDTGFPDTLEEKRGER